MTDPTEYDADSPAAFDIRVRHGAAVLDMLLGSADWRATLDVDRILGANILTLLEDAGSPVGYSQLADVIPFYARLADYGLDCFAEACEDTADAWRRLLTPYRAAVLSLSS